MYHVIHELILSPTKGVQIELYLKNDGHYSVLNIFSFSYCLKLK